MFVQLFRPWAGLFGSLSELLAAVLRSVVTLSPAPFFTFTQDLFYSPKVHVVGLLATTDISPEGDGWMAIDFRVWRDLLSEATNAQWFTAATLDDEVQDIIGDPWGDRLLLPRDSTRLALIPDIERLKPAFLVALSRVASLAHPADSLVIVICGHGQETTGDVFVGDPGGIEDTPLSKEMVVDALQGIPIPQTQIFLVSTACYSGRWTNSMWTLFAGAKLTAESIPIRKSRFEESRNASGIFTVAALAEQADGLTAPHSEPIPGHTDRGLLSAPLPGNIDSAIPRRSMCTAMDFMQALRLRMGSTYAITPFVPDQFSVVGPSGDTKQVPTEAKLADSAVHAPLSDDDEAELRALANAYTRRGYPSTATNVPVNALAKQYAKGNILTPTKQWILLTKLRFRARECRRATAIADFLGWERKTEADEWLLPSGLEEMMRAEAAGAAIATEFMGIKVGVRVGTGKSLWKTPAPGAWLADVWMNAGEPFVDSSLWGNAVAYANDLVEHTVVSSAILLDRFR